MKGQKGTDSWKTGRNEESGTVEERVRVWEEQSNQQCPIMTCKDKARSALTTVHGTW